MSDGENRIISIRPELRSRTIILPCAYYHGGSHFIAKNVRLLTFSRQHINRSFRYSYTHKISKSRMCTSGYSGVRRKGSNRKRHLARRRRRSYISTLSGTYRNYPCACANVRSKRRVHNRYTIGDLVAMRRDPSKGRDENINNNNEDDYDAVTVTSKQGSMGPKYNKSTCVNKRGSMCASEALDSYQKAYGPSQKQSSKTVETVNSGRGLQQGAQDNDERKKTTRGMKGVCTVSDSNRNLEDCGLSYDKTRKRTTPRKDGKPSPGPMKHDTAQLHDPYLADDSDKIINRLVPQTSITKQRSLRFSSDIIHQSRSPSKGTAKDFLFRSRWTDQSVTGSKRDSVSSWPGRLKANDWKTIMTTRPRSITSNSSLFSNQANRNERTRLSRTHERQPSIRENLLTYWDTHPELYNPDMIPLSFYKMKTQAELSSGAELLPAFPSQISLGSIIRSSVPSIPSFTKDFMSRPSMEGVSASALTSDQIPARAGERDSFFTAKSVRTLPKLHKRFFDVGKSDSKKVSFGSADSMLGRQSSLKIKIITGDRSSDAIHDTESGPNLVRLPSVDCGRQSISLLAGHRVELAWRRRVARIPESSHTAGADFESAERRHHAQDTHRAFSCCRIPTLRHSPAYILAPQQTRLRVLLEPTEECGHRKTSCRQLAERLNLERILVGRTYEKPFSQPSTIVSQRTPPFGDPRQPREERISSSGDRRQPREERVSSSGDRRQPREERVSSSGDRRQPREERVSSSGDRRQPREERVSSSGDRRQPREERISSSGDRRQPREERTSPFDDCKKPHEGPFWKGAVRIDKYNIGTQRFYPWAPFNPAQVKRVQQRVLQAARALCVPHLSPIPPRRRFPKVASSLDIGKKMSSATGKSTLQLSRVRAGRSKSVETQLESSESL